MGGKPVMKAVGQRVERKRLMRISSWWRGTVFSSVAVFAPPLLQQPQTFQSSPSLFSPKWGRRSPAVHPLRLPCSGLEKYFERFSNCIRILGRMTVQRILNLTHYPFPFSEIYRNRKKGICEIISYYGCVARFNSGQSADGSYR